MLITVPLPSVWRQTGTVNPDLYPDLVAAGSLSAALEQMTARLGVALAVIPPEGGNRVTASMASSDPRRGPLSVYIGAKERLFMVSGWCNGIEAVTGATSDLAEVVKAAAGWGQGTPLPELRALAPFLHSSQSALAAERGPAAVVELKWRTMREQAAEGPDFPEFGTLIEAAHAEPRLRQLYVFSSHWTLGFSSCTGYPFRVEVAIAPGHGGAPYRVMQRPYSASIGETATAEEAVRLAVSQLPAGLGPAIAGTAEQH